MKESPKLTKRQELIPFPESSSSSMKAVLQLSSSLTFGPHPRSNTAVRFRLLGVCSREYEAWAMRSRFDRCDHILWGSSAELFCLDRARSLSLCNVCARPTQIGGAFPRASTCRRQGTPTNCTRDDVIAPETLCEYYDVHAAGSIRHVVLAIIAAGGMNDGNVSRPTPFTQRRSDTPYETTAGSIRVQRRDQCKYL